MNNDILNYGLELAMEFGENWLQPIQERLSVKYPELTKMQLDTYNSLCRSTMDKGHEFVYNYLEAASNAGRKADRHEVAAHLRSYFSKDRVWVNEENLSRILNQGFYYAWREGFT